MPKKVCTFNRVLSLEEAEKERESGSRLGESLREADRLYEERKRRK